MIPNRTDIAIVGGGLAGGLAAHALALRRPDLSVSLIESAAIGGNHVWSFFDSDIDPADRPIVAPFVGHRWSGYDVAFPQFARTIATGYNSIRSDAFAARLAERLPAGTIVHSGARALDRDGVTLADGRRIAAGLVIDARGPSALNGVEAGWQAFVGQELRLAQPHGLERPVVMDATVAQLGGYRFVYLLPFGPDRVFVEDTYYIDDPALDTDAVRGRIAEYVAARGWTVAAVEHEETGALPVVIGGSHERLRDGAPAGVPAIGARAGLFHPTTGYSLPDAVRTAALIADCAGDGSPPVLAALGARLDSHAAARWRERGFYRMLDRMLFRAAVPEERFRVLQRFYRLDDRLIGRFYAARSTWADRARVLVGRPPVPIGRAVAALAAGAGR